MERRGVASRGASASGAGGGEGCLGTPNLQMSGTSGGSAETRRRRTIRAASMARASNAGATEPVASAVGAEGYPREARARVRGEAAHAEGTRSPESARGRRGIILRANAEGVDGRRSHLRGARAARGTGAPELGDELAFEREKYDIIPVPR